MDAPCKADGALTSQLEALLARQRPFLLAQAYNLCRNAVDAEDLVQEVFVRFLAVFSRLSNLPEERTCAAWLVATLTHCFYDQLRRQRVRERGVEDPTLVGRVQGTSEPPAPEVYERISDEQFKAAVQALSPKVRTALELHARGRKYREIAQELGIPAGTVAKRLHDARSRLRKLLEPYLLSGEH